VKRKEDLLDGKYDTIKELGRGAFGVVVLAKDVTNQQLYAIKRLECARLSKYTEAEVTNHRILRHPHVVELREVFINEVNATELCVVMEYANGGNLLRFMQQAVRLKEEQAHWFFSQLVMAVDYCHQRGVANRDIKLDNTLLHHFEGAQLPVVKLCDFGYSKHAAKSTAKTQAGTFAYMAPEVLINSNGKYDPQAADIWSCGVCLYVMLYGRYPFDANHQEKPANMTPEEEAAYEKQKALAVKNQLMWQLQRMVKAEYPMPASVVLTPGCKDLLKRMLTATAQERITMKGILEHPWFTARLPKDALSLTQRCLACRLPPGLQSDEDMRALIRKAENLVRRARMPAAAAGPADKQAAGGGGGDEDDEGIDEEQLELELEQEILTEMDKADDPQLKQWASFHKRD